METDIIVLDDEQAVAQTLGSILEGCGYTCSVQTDARAAIALATVSRPKLFITDLKMPDLTGEEVLEELKRVDARLPVILITGYGTINDAVTAMKNGAYDFIAKPFNIDHIAKVVARALKSKEPNPAETETVRSQARARFITCYQRELSPEMKARVELASIGSASRDPVAVVGAPATGKRTLAAIIHGHSLHSREPLLLLDCAHLAPGEQVDKLFGGRGNAHGAARPRGFLEVAGKGTIVIESVEKASPNLLSGLERLLRAGEYDAPDGSTRFSEARIILTSTSSGAGAGEDTLPAGIREWARLQVIAVPALKERPNHVLAFAEFFLAEYCVRYGIADLKISPDAAHLLARHAWSGNLRELENTIERAVLLTQGAELTLDTLPLELQSRAQGRWHEREEPMTLKRMQVEQVHHVIARHQGDRRAAAAELGISLRTLYRKISRRPAKNPGSAS